MGFLNSGTTYSVDVTKVLIAGDSAGGNLAAAVSHYLAFVAERHCRRNYIVGQVCNIITPCYMIFFVV